ncbi:hypothetical protein IFM89_011209 [Coptis chinensis]|uniref:Protein kinase domain-containing protein n=1 Tax=Coptis chinensis TaxID=261450 RepID=A0A835LV51_9MAGN|nr:hypothetical protein IFM89_011209 [Coptis chinensis]
MYYSSSVASWFRLKYPHIALGAWASSAPVLYYLGDTKRSWDLIDGIGSSGNGLKELSQKFKSCSLLKSSKELKDYLQRKYQDAAQYDSPEDTPVEKICSVIDAMSTNSDVLSRIFAGIEAIEGNEPPKCYPILILTTYASIYQWTWQVSQIDTELIEPSTTSTNDTMFQIPSASYNQKEYCEELDLKPENFLLVNGVRILLFKATDFGVSVFIEEGKVYRDIVGSAYYVEPEVLGRSYGKDIDVWSAGDLVKKMLTWDPKKRINAAQALGDKHNVGWCYKFWETQLDRLATKDQTYQDCTDVTFFKELEVREILGTNSISW